MGSKAGLYDEQRPPCPHVVFHCIRVKQPVAILQGNRGQVRVHPGRQEVIPGAARGKRDVPVFRCLQVITFHQHVGLLRGSSCGMDCDVPRQRVIAGNAEFLVLPCGHTVQASMEVPAIPVLELPGGTYAPVDFIQFREVVHRHHQVIRQHRGIVYLAKDKLRRMDTDANYVLQLRSGAKRMHGFTELLRIVRQVEPHAIGLRPVHPRKHCAIEFADLNPFSAYVRLKFSFCQVIDILCQHKARRVIVPVWVILRQVRITDGSRVAVNLRGDNVHIREVNVIHVNQLVVGHVKVVLQDDIHTVLIKRAGAHVLKPRVNRPVNAPYIVRDNGVFPVQQEVHGTVTP